MSGITVRRLHPGDEADLVAFVEVDHLFEHDPSTTRTSTPIDRVTAAAFLADPAVRAWLAEVDGAPVGYLHVVVLRLLEAVASREALLYDIGTHVEWRRRGVGRLLLAAMDAQLLEEGVEEVWVGAARTAVGFYRACGYEASDEVFMARELTGAAGSCDPAS